ncbi:hypothetical protein PanWU01x14_140360 [Parasponia andersonii]|uniref:Uncharacterized protein n=1 Tax=Parasponia andersonii TaxID=3476 RepID=A0A2P5CME3_PARAD|nr:hypothetical protein PanWU01x14_140360 [Parasponia andersonii]
MAVSVAETSRMAVTCGDIEFCTRNKGKGNASMNIKMFSLTTDTVHLEQKSHRRYVMQLVSEDSLKVFVSKD